MSDSDIFDLIGKECHHSIPSQFIADECKKEEEVFGSDLKCWANSRGSYWGISQTFPLLPSNCYKAEENNQGIFLESVPIITDNLLVLPDSSTNLILDDFNQFWTLKDQFKKRGFLHKRGILMWGPPGSGKTSTIQIIIQKVIKDLNGVVLIVCNPYKAIKALQMIRKIEPDRPIIAILEDLDSLVSSYDESGFLSMLDGESQVDNIVHLATTNYPERLDPRFIDRPSRFDVIRKIDMPSEESRRCYLQLKEPSLTSEELDLWVNLSKGLSIPHLKEMIISIKCYNRDIQETVNRLNRMHKKNFKSGEKELGFNV